MRGPKAPKWLKRGKVSPEVQAALSAALVVGALVVAGFAYFGPPWREADSKETYVQATAEGERLLLTLADVSLGAVERDGSRESIDWTSLKPAAGRMEIADGRTGLASGPVTRDGLVVAQLRFAGAGYIVAGALYELPIPQDTLRLVIPGAPGRPGQTLLLTFDADRSIAHDGGVLSFRPFVSRAVWLGDDGNEAAPGDGIGPENTLFRWGDLAGDNDAGRTSGGSGNGGSGGSGSNGGGAAPRDVGRVHVFVRDADVPVIETLNITFRRVGIGDGTTVTTYFEGLSTVDLRRYAGPGDRASLAQFQVPARAYETLEFEFHAANGRISGTQADLAVPQPRLVLERSFVVPPGATIEFLVDFHLGESVRAGLAGFEFRPVVFQLQVSDEDTDGDGTPDTLDPDDDNDGTPDMDDLDRDGDGTLDRRPAQYRTGGSPMPTLGAAGGPAETLEGSDGTGTVAAVGGVLGDDEDETRPVDDTIDDLVPDLPVP